MAEIKVFDYDHGQKDIGVRRYIWLAEYDYVLLKKGVPRFAGFGKEGRGEILKTFSILFRDCQ